MTCTNHLDLRGLLPSPRRRAVVARRRRRTAVLYAAALFLVWAILALSRAAGAQDGPTPADPCVELREATQGLEAEPTRHVLEGVAGQWFPTPIVRLMLCEVRELRARRRVVELAVREIRLWEQQVEFTERQRELAVEARDHLEGVVDDADRRAREALAALGAWYRSPILWTIVGIVIGGGVIIGGAYLAAAVP